MSRTRAGVRAGWALSSARTFGYSISPERGLSFGLGVEAVRRALGASGEATTLTADVRGYVPGFSRHQILALRLAGGASSGGDLRRTFLLGGGAANAGTLDFGSEAITLLRGFPLDTFAGTHVALANIDYRVPIARPERGAGTWPLFVRAVHGAAFLDLGHAWTRTFDARDLKVDAGGELGLDVVAGYSVPLTVAAGAAWGRDGSGLVRGGAVYLRVGRAF